MADDIVAMLLILKLNVLQVKFQVILQLKMALIPMVLAVQQLSLSHPVVQNDSNTSAQSQSHPSDQNK